MQTLRSKTAGLIIICIIFVLAAIAGVYVYNLFYAVHLIVRLFLADTAATVMVFVFSLILRNASVYDPYWSVAPVVMLTLLALQLNHWDAGTLLLVVVVFYWGVRLTANWIYTFRNLTVQDWRYDMLRKANPKTFPLVSLIGIHMMPTIVVFLAMIPAVYYLQAGGLNAFTFVGIAVCIAGATLELISDLQMHRFRRCLDCSRVIETGLWKYARHPNYLGEICMWWGVYIIMLSVLPQRWYFFVGALANTLLFVLISIPMAEKRMAGNKPGYGDYKNRTRLLLPIPRFKIKNDL